ncbi:MAG: hypothetical protein M1581_03845 [Candidatus Thermoplasmatota archaeon]|jgi:hypothetical protein|nr:hypothetical protein [Candidatus Thermoplasmatota archaeon]
MAIEKCRNSDTGMFYSDKHRNNRIKAIISIFATESNALPYDMEITTTTSNIATSSVNAGDIMAYEIWNRGQLPNAKDLAIELTAVLIDVGIGTYLSVTAVQEISWDIATTFLADGSISDIAMDVTIDSGIYVDLVTLAAIVTPVIAW